MTAFYRAVVLFVLCLVLSTGCIPSSPPAPEPTPQVEAVKKPEPAPAVQQPAPPVQQPVAEQAAVPEAPAAADTAPAVGNAGVQSAHLEIPSSIGVGDLPPGFVPLPAITFVPMEDGKGYVLKSDFHMEGLSMEGTITLQAPGEWLLSGNFISSFANFQPGKPELLGNLDPASAPAPEAGAPPVALLISFSAPMPAPDSPRLDEPKKIPFTLAIKAPDNTTFNIMLMPL